MDYEGAKVEILECNDNWGLEYLINHRLSVHKIIDIQYIQPYVVGLQMKYTAMIVYKNKDAGDENGGILNISEE